MVQMLSSAGYSIWVHDTSPSRLDEICLLTSAKVFNENSDLSIIDVVITMLPDSNTVEDALFGNSGVASRLKKGVIVIDMSSSEPMRSRHIYKKLSDIGISYVDAPVSGGVKRAIDGTLAIMAGGDVEAFQKVDSILGVMGKNIFHVGEAGSGHAVKALNNYLSAITTIATAEALIIGKSFGLDQKKMVEVFNASTGRSNATENKALQFMVSGTFSAGFTMSLMVKDITIASQLGEQVGYSMDMGDASLQAWGKAMHLLGKTVDHTAVYQYVESKLNK
jgi:3-hydroxyisobutyrate dehydrogenase